MVTVFGLGFVGLTTALGFADKGYKVFGLDINEERVNKISNGELPFFEADMDDALARNNGKNFVVTDDIAMAVKNSLYIFFCVGTPHGENSAANLSYLYKAIDAALEYIADDVFRVLVIKSTVPPATTSEYIVPYIQNKGIAVGQDIGVANNPEFLREGYCWDDFINADRIVLGCNDLKSEKMLKDLYKVFDIPIIVTNYNTGEFIKYLSNSLLATLISYSNEMSLIADKMGNIDIKKAFKTVHMDKRWNGCNMTSYVYPGCGYGGYCLPKDTNALYSQSVSKGYLPKILGEVIAINDTMPEKIAKKIVDVAKEKRIGILGLSFKPCSDDVRDAPAARIIKVLQEWYDNEIFAHDPIAVDQFKRQYDFQIQYCENINEIIKKSDILAVITAWPEYKTIRTLTDKPIVDCRYFLEDVYAYS